MANSNQEYMSREEVIWIMITNTFVTKNAIKISELQKSVAQNPQWGESDGSDIWSLFLAWKHNADALTILLSNLEQPG